MTTSPPPADEPPKVDLGKHPDGGQGTPAEGTFDPYRFGRPEHPVPPEYAPPGYGHDATLYGAPWADPDVQPWGTPYVAPPNPYGPASAHPPSYGPQPPGGYGPHGYGPPTGSNGKAVTAMVLGILSIPFSFVSVFDLALIIPALVYGILGLSEAKRRNGTGRKQAIAGIVCLIVGVVAATVFTVLYSNAHQVCQRYYDSGNDHAYQSCVSHQLGT